MIAVPIHRRTAIGALAAGVLLAAAATVPAHAQDELVALETVRTTPRTSTAASARTKRPTCA